MLLLGIETSCDDTATAVVRDGRDVLSSVATNQDEFHAKYGGIVPEIASRRHVALLSAAVEDALERAGTTLEEIDGIAVTAGPGLIGSLVVGVAGAKALAFASNKPLYAVNHLHGHVFAPFLDRPETPPYPFLALLVSGGHSQLVAVDSPVRMRILGRTHDDAAGEAFDKTARLLGLPYPGGPELDRLARTGDPKAYAFPRYRPAGDALDFSFSGLKTSVRYFLESPSRSRGRAGRRRRVVSSRRGRCLDDATAIGFRTSSLQCRCGLRRRRRKLRARVRGDGLEQTRWCSGFHPPPKYCTDNAAMIAAAAFYQRDATRADPLSMAADPNLPFALTERAGHT